MLFFVFRCHFYTWRTGVTPGILPCVRILTSHMLLNYPVPSVPPVQCILGANWGKVYRVLQGVPFQSHSAEVSGDVSFSSQLLFFCYHPLTSSQVSTSVRCFLYFLITNTEWMISGTVHLLFHCPFYIFVCLLKWVLLCFNIGWK